ncbi:MAG: permease prefix domain 1-containing protein [Planctomycetota bacterium]
MSQQEFEHYLSLLARMLRLTPQQRDAIADELRAHLEERLEDLQAEGHDREKAIALALDEFGDANALAADFTDTLHRAHRRRNRRRLMQTTAGTLIAAAVVTFAVMTLTPRNFQGSPNQAPAVAQNHNDAAHAAQTVTMIDAGQSLADLSVDAGIGRDILDLLRQPIDLELHRADVREAIETVAAHSGVANLVLLDSPQAKPQRPSNNASARIGRGGGGMGGFGGGMGGGFGMSAPASEPAASNGVVTLHLQQVPALEALDLIREMSGQRIAAELRDHTLVFRVLEPVDPRDQWDARTHDITPLLEAALDAAWEADRTQHELEYQLTEHLTAVLRGSKYREDIGAIHSLFGTLTVIGSSESDAFVDDYLERLTRRLIRRAQDLGLRDERNASADPPTPPAGGLQEAIFKVRQIMLIQHSFAEDHGGRFPASTAELADALPEYGMDRSGFAWRMIPIGDADQTTDFAERVAVFAWTDNADLFAVGFVDGSARSMPRSGLDALLAEQTSQGLARWTRNP